MARIHERGQLTLPKAMRDEIGLKPGDDVSISVRDDEIVIRKARGIFDFRLPPRPGAGEPEAEKNAWADAAAADPVNQRRNAG